MHSQFMVQNIIRKHVPRQLVEKPTYTCGVRRISHARVFVFSSPQLVCPFASFPFFFLFFFFLGRTRITANSLFSTLRNRSRSRLRRIGTRRRGWKRYPPPRRRCFELVWMGERAWRRLPHPTSLSFPARSLFFSVRVLPPD